MQFLDGGATGPNGQDSGTARSAEQGPAGTDPQEGGRGSLMSRYRGTGQPGSDAEEHPPSPRTGETPAGSAASAPGGTRPSTPGASADSSWRQSAWTSAPPVPPVPPVPPPPPAANRTGTPADSAPTSAPVSTPAKTEPSKPESPPTGTPNTGTASTGSASTAPASTGSASSAPASAAPGSTGAPSTAAAAPETPKADAPNPDVPKADVPKADATKADAPASPAAAVTRGSVPGSTGVPGRTPGPDSVLLPADRTTEFRARWRDVQSEFVDDPQHAVRGAGDLSRDILQALADTIADAERVDSWRAEDGTSATEDLRIALRRYRTLVDRLLEL
jgi:hypothetical protein